MLKYNPFLWALLICWWGESVQADQQLFQRKIAPIVIIDPGHGGYDTGSRGAAGTLEKDVSLALARLLVAELKDRFQVILTRSDDYWLDINSRAAEANHQRGDLFVSLHTAAGFRFDMKGMTVSYYQETSVDPSDPMANGEMPVDGEDLSTWEKAQRPHHPTSKSLAEALQNGLDQAMGESAARVQGLPLAILSGVDMPAAIIEIGYLANPAEELKLLDNSHMLTLAKAISQGIDRFFSKKR